MEANDSGLLSPEEIVQNQATYVILQLQKGPTSDDIIQSTK